jgi:hypothetical protein
MSLSERLSASRSHHQREQVRTHPEPSPSDYIFKDGSVHDERVVFSQQRVFTLVSYHLIQQGPSFPEHIDASVDRGTAKYQVRSRTGKDGKEQVRSGQFALPDDVYNGMLVTVLLNLDRGSDVTVRILSFTPTPEVIPCGAV